MNQQKQHPGAPQWVPNPFSWQDLFSKRSFLVVAYVIGYHGLHGAWPWS